MTPIPLEEDLEKELNEIDIDEGLEELTKKECSCNKKQELPELIHKDMNNINTFQCCEGELYLRGTDEYGRDFQICFDAYNFLDWIDTENIEYIKEQLIKHIKTK